MLFADGGKLLAGALQLADLFDRLLLLQKSHPASANLGIQVLDLGIYIGLARESDGINDGLNFLPLLPHLIVHALDVVLGRIAGGLAGALLLLDLVQLGNKLGTALLGRVLGVLSRGSKINLGLDSVLEIRYMISAGYSIVGSDS